MSKNYRGIKCGWKNICRDLSRVCRVTRGLIDNEQGDFRDGRGCVDQSLY